MMTYRQVTRKDGTVALAWIEHHGKIVRVTVGKEEDIMEYMRQKGQRRPPRRY